MAKNADAAITCRRADLADVRQIALDIGRRESRTVPLWEVVKMLIEHYRRTAAGAAPSDGGR